MTQPSANPRKYSKGKNLDPEAPLYIYLALEITEDDLLTTAKRVEYLTTIHPQADISSELRTLEPHLSHSVTRGAYYPQDSQCQPMLAAAQMLKVVQRSGGEFLSGANVTAIAITQGAVSGLLTSKGSFSTPIVVNATGTWAGQIAELAGSYLPIAPRRGFILVTVPTHQLIFHKVYDAEYVANVASDESEN